MEHLKAWAQHHKALAIGGSIGAVVLLYLWFRSAGASSSSSAAAPDASGLDAYYQAQASGAADDASTSEATDALDAQENQTNAEETASLAQTSAAVVPYQAQLDADTLQANLTAYQDYLGEGSGGGTSVNAAEFTDPTNGNQYIQTTAEVAAGNNYDMFDETTGQVVNVAAGGTGVTTGTPFTRGYFDGTTFTPQAAASAPLTFGQFQGVTAPTLSSGTGGGTSTTATG